MNMGIHLYRPLLGWHWKAGGESGKEEFGTVRYKTHLYYCPALCLEASGSSV